MTLHIAEACGLIHINSQNYTTVRIMRCGEQLATHVVWAQSPYSISVGYVCLEEPTCLRCIGNMILDKFEPMLTT